MIWKPADFPILMRFWLTGLFLTKAIKMFMLKFLWSFFPSFTPSSKRSHRIWKNIRFYTLMHFWLTARFLTKAIKMFMLKFFWNFFPSTFYGSFVVSFITGYLHLFVFNTACPINDKDWTSADGISFLTHQWRKVSFDDLWCRWDNN